MLKLIDKYIYLNLSLYTKVKYATQVLNHTVVNFLDILILNQGKTFIFGK